MTSRLLFVALVMCCSPAVLAREYSAPIPGEPRKFVVEMSSLDKKSVPQLTAVVPDTLFIVINTEGGSLFLGPLVSAASIKGKATSIAKAGNGGYFGADVEGIARRALSKVDMPDAASAPIYSVKPIAFIQRCALDKKYRAAFAFQVTGPGKKNWMGRYIAHLKMAVTYDAFMHPAVEDIAAFAEDLSA